MDATKENCFTALSYLRNGGGDQFIHDFLVAAMKRLPKQESVDKDKAQRVKARTKK